MKWKGFFLGIAICVFSFTAAASEETPLQSQASFEAAVRNQSTAPPYVLITVVDARSEETRSICTTVNLLLGAIHREYGIQSDREGQVRAQQIALANKNHVFRFTTHEALANIPLYYSQDDLAFVRTDLQALSVSQLREGFSAFGKLHSIYHVSPMERSRAYRDATACVLIERGLSPGMGCRSGRLWLAP
jgi:hypothetical protein